jgi:hypothetical protein
MLSISIFFHISFIPMHLENTSLVLSSSALCCFGWGKINSPVTSVVVSSQRLLLRRGSHHGFCRVVGDFMPPSAIHLFCDATDVFSLHQAKSASQPGIRAAEIDLLAEI